ncbi:MAG: hypothetical protein ACYSU0_21210 [Planctomycetota bacterium]|jgi:hypothetical protein
MRHNLALLLIAAALVSPVGCLGESPMFAVGGGRVDDWSVPAPMQEPGEYSGVNVSLTPDVLSGIPALGLYRYFDGDERLTGPYVTYNFGGLAWLALLRNEEAMALCPIVNPVIGLYHWSESPEGVGLLTGVKLGVGALIHFGGETGDSTLFLTYDHGWLKAHDAFGDHDAEFQTRTVAILYIVKLAPF